MLSYHVIFISTPHYCLVSVRKERDRQSGLIFVSRTIVHNRMKICPVCIIALLVCLVVRSYQSWMGIEVRDYLSKLFVKCKQSKFRATRDCMFSEMLNSNLIIM